MIFYKTVIFIFLILISTEFAGIDAQRGCPPMELILPCRCLMRGQEFQIWCSHSSLSNVLDGLKSLGRYLPDPIDELILENNFLPSLSGRTFSPLKVIRLMLRQNSLERVSGDWLADLESSLMEIFIVEPQLTSLPEFSLSQLKNLRAVTIQSRAMKYLPIFSGLPKLKYIHIESNSLLALSPANFKDNPSLEKLHIQSSPRLTRLEANLFDDLPKLDLINITGCGLNWMHPRVLGRLPSLKELSLIGNKFTDAGMVGRSSRDVPLLEILRLDHNRIGKLTEATFVDLPSLKKIHLSNNLITEIQHGAFHRLPALRSLDMNNNLLVRFHPRSFLHPLESHLEELLLMYNDISDVMELRSLLDGLPRLVFLDMSYNRLRSIPYGALKGHPTLEQINLGYNMLSIIHKEAFIAMPALRELKLMNNSLTDLLETPFWNLPALKGLDLGKNSIRKLDPRFFANVGSLRRMDLSNNELIFLHPEVFVPTPFLEHINASHNSLKIIHPVTFRHLTQLYEVDLSHNSLKNLVAQLPKNIERLHLHHNEISKISIQDLVLPSLRLLDLSFNSIQDIPRGSLKGLVHLKRLHLTSNPLQTINDLSFDGLDQLETLDLSRNRLVQIHPGSMKSLGTLKNLNIANNEVNLVGPNLLTRSKNIQNIDFSGNKISEIFPGTLDSSENVEILNMSHNLLVQIPQALYGRRKLKKLDLASNRIKNINSTVLSSLTSLRELKLSKNFIKLLEENTFTNLQQIKNIYLDDNELEFVEPNALKMLPVLKSIKLDKNKIIFLPSMAFNTLPLLQSIELQQNELKNIEPNAFNLVPHVLLLNLSYNELSSIENVGLPGLNSVELLDLSFNRISRLAGANLRKLEWLVELKMDNNGICEVEEGVFDKMMRLKALSLVNNKIVYIPEMAAQRLRSNVANIDIKGNPLLCSCNMLWLQAWLKESSQEGPKCADGTLLREMRLAPQECPVSERSKKIRNGCDAELLNGADYFNKPNIYTTSQILSHPKNNLKTFPKGTSESLSKGSSANKNYLAPSPEESDYFYDDYIDYPFNESTSDIATVKVGEVTTQSVVNRFEMPSKFPNENTTGNTPTLYAAVKKPKPTVPPKVSYSPSTSGFTFFGLPIPSFNEKKKLISQFENLRLPPLPELQGGFIPILPGDGGFKPIPDPNLPKPKPTVKSEIRKVNIERSEVVTNRSTSLHFSNSTTASTNRNKKSQLVPEELTQTAFHLQSIANVKIANHTEKRSFNERPKTLTEKHAVAEQSVQKPVFSKTTIPPVIETTTMELEMSTLSKVEDYVTTTISSGTKKEPEGLPKLVEKKPTKTEKLIEDPPHQAKPSVPTPIKSEIVTDPTVIINPTGSMLSTFLAPGGQQLHVKPSAKSTITKVASPHNSARAPLLSGLELSGEINLPTDVKILGEVDDMLVTSTDASFSEHIENWYFDNYNRNNLEPFVAKIVNASRGSIRIVHRVWIMVVVLGYLM
ncbi:hypothetical protein JTB14_000311 [Gonioctena quinquepunctata]|nr:hypothetical protein JTB14_000311 [Gonioctena quinquepunctata]